MIFVLPLNFTSFDSEKCTNTVVLPSLHSPTSFITLSLAEGPVSALTCSEWVSVFSLVKDIWFKHSYLIYLLILTDQNNHIFYHWSQFRCHTNIQKDVIICFQFIVLQNAWSSYSFCLKLFLPWNNRPVWSWHLSWLSVLVSLLYNL